MRFFVVVKQRFVVQLFAAYPTFKNQFLFMNHFRVVIEISQSFKGFITACTFESFNTRVGQDVAAEIGRFAKYFAALWTRQCLGPSVLDFMPGQLGRGRETLSTLVAPMREIFGTGFHMVLQRPLGLKSETAIFTNVRSFPCMLMAVNLQRNLTSKSFAAGLTFKFELLRVDFWMMRVKQIPGVKGFSTFVTE